MTAGAEVDVSIVLPCFNEQDCVERLTREIVGVLEPLGRSYEILFVDDASTDRSAEILEALRDEIAALRLVRHAINSGESAAEATGFRFARGEVIVTMDSDEQNDPASIPDLLHALDQGADVVSGVRIRRADDWVKRISSRVGNGFRNFVTGDRVADAGCTFRAIRRTALAELPVFNGMHRFLPTILRYQGFTVAEIPVRHRPRVTGSSKYGIGNRMFRGIADCIAMRWYRRRVVRARRVDPVVSERPAALLHR
jgi:glycosyltransferase involved in cell wall biosynthesis